MAAAGAFVALGVPAGAASAATSADILPGSRIRLNAGASATATRGDTLYLGGTFGSIGYRAGGLAATDATSGALDRTVPELVSADHSYAAAADRLVPDGAGGVYALGLRNGENSFVLDPSPSLETAADGANWAHFDASGAGEQAAAQRFTVGDGDERRTARVFDVAVAGDGTTYFSGDFDAVDGQARSGLAALRPDGTLASWAPALAGGVAGRLHVVGDGVLLVGGVTFRYTADGAQPDAFASVDGQPRAGLALVAGDTGAVRAWRPAGLSATDAESGVAVDGSTVYLAAPGAVRAVGTTGTGVVRDLGLQPHAGSILGVAAAGGTLYVSGGFDAIGSQSTQPERPGLAEVDPATGRATAWAPQAQPGSSTLAVTADRVYAGGAYDVCAAAFGRATGVRAAWEPQLGDGNTCNGVTGLAAVGSRVWAAGTFEMAEATSRGGFAAIDVAKDQILDWSPRSDNAGGQGVQDLALSPDGSTVYLAADRMGAVNGVPRRAVAAVAATGSARSADDVRPWDPAAENTDNPFNLSVAEVAPVGDGSTVVLGGAFMRVGGQDRPFLAATSSTSGAPTAWRPAPDGPVTALEAAGDGTLYVGGSFTHAGVPSAPRQFLAAFAGLTSAAPTAWNPGLAEGAGFELYDLALGDGVVYAGGDFDGTIGGKTRHGVAALDRTTGQATAWDAELNGAARTVSTGADGTVYLAGGAFGFTTVRGQERGNNLASLTPAGEVTGWNPGSIPAGEPASFVGVGDGYGASGEIQEVGGRVVAPGSLQSNVFAGLPQQGFLSFGTASALPTLTTAPVVTGKRLAGERLTCKPGVYGGGSVSRRVAWLRAGDPIAGQTGGSYVVRDADVGRDVACRETATNAVGPLATTSAAVRIVASAPTAEAAPEVTGTPAIGRTLTCTEGLWSNVPSAYAYRWLRDGAAVDGATGASYAVVATDVGHGLACEVTATNDAGASKPARSAVVRVSAADQGPGPGGPEQGGTPTTPTTPQAPTPTTPTVPKAPTPTTPTAPVKPRISVAAKAVAGKGRRITVTVTPSGAGRVGVAASTGSGRNRVAVGSGGATAKKAGALKVTVSPSSKGRKALRAGRTVKVTFRVTFTAADGQRVVSSRTIKVKIRR